MTTIMRSIEDARLMRAHQSWHDEHDGQVEKVALIQAHHTITAEMTRRGVPYDCTDTHVSVEVSRAAGVSTDPATYDGLPMEMVAALRQAWDEGVALVDVCQMLNADGYELVVMPAETGDGFAALIGTDAPDTADAPEPADDPVAGLLDMLAELIAERMGVGKGMSFASENRLIARNKRRRAAAEPHPFKAARWATRTGAVRCVVCGGGQTDTGACTGLGYAKATDTYNPPKGAQTAAQRALAWIADGKAGSGFTDTGRARAAQLARGDAVSADTVQRMASYFARHEVDRDATGFNAGEDGYPSPGRVAWDAWGGDAGRSWATRISDTLTKDSPDVNSVHVDTIMGGGKRNRRMTKDDTAYEPMLNDRQAVMADAYEMIVEAFGPFDQSSGADGAHYMPASGNPFSSHGLRCANCVFYEGGGGCELVSGQVEPDAVCKLWVIEESLITEQSTTKAAVVPSLAAVTKADGALRYTMGPMYVPDTLDAHDEWTDADELQRAVWDYVRSGDRRIRLQHNVDVVAGEWVECMTWPYPVTVPAEGADGTSTDYTFPANTVFLGVVWEPWAWELVKADRLRGYSIGGKAERIMVDLPETTGEQQV